MLATLLAATALAAAPFPQTIPVPPGSLPEGIATGNGNTFYVGSRPTAPSTRGNLPHAARASSSWRAATAARPTA